MVAQSVLLGIGVVGMAGTENVAQVVVVSRMLIGVANQETNGTARGLAFEYARKQFHTVSLLPSCGETALAWATAVQFVLQEIKVNGDVGRHSVDDSANAFAVAFPKGGQREKVSESVAHKWLSVNGKRIIFTCIRRNHRYSRRNRLHSRNRCRNSAFAG